MLVESLKDQIQDLRRDRDRLYDLLYPQQHMQRNVPTESFEPVRSHKTISEVKKELTDLHKKKAAEIELAKHEKEEEKAS